LDAECRGRRLGGVLVRGADRLQLVIGQRLERGDVGIGSPAAAALGQGRSDDSDANLVCHLSLPVQCAFDLACSRSGTVPDEAAIRGGFVTARAFAAASFSLIFASTASRARLKYSRWLTTNSRDSRNLAR